MLACVRNLDRSGQIPCVVDGTEVSKNIRNWILQECKICNRTGMESSGVTGAVSNCM